MTRPLDTLLAALDDCARRRTPASWSLAAEARDAITDLEVEVRDLRAALERQSRRRDNP